MSAILLLPLHCFFTLLLFFFFSLQDDFLPRTSTPIVKIFLLSSIVL